jgi:hypothetical protein
MPEPLSYRIGADVRQRAAIEWLEALESPTRPALPGRLGRPPVRREAAAQFLSERLKDGKRLFREIEDEARESGISVRTLQRAVTLQAVKIVEQGNVYLELCRERTGAPEA